MASRRDGLRIRLPALKLIQDDNPLETVKKKPPKTAAQRAKEYRERLKMRTDYEDNIRREKNEKAKKYRDNLKANASEEDKRQLKEKTRLRVQQFRERRKENGVTPTSTPNIIMTRHQKDSKRKQDRERKKKERENWTPQKWRRHREACRARYHIKKNLKVNSETEKKNAECESKSKRTFQRKFKKLTECLPSNPSTRKEMILKLIKKHKIDLTEIARLRKIDLTETSVVLKTDRLTKRKIGQQLLKKAMHQEVHKAFSITRAYLHRLERLPNQLCLRQRSTRSIKRHHEAQSYYVSEEYANQLSEKKKIKKGKPTFVLKETINNLYAVYRSKVEDPLSLAMFKRLRPRNVRLSRDENLNQCLCDICQNIKLKLETINKNLPAGCKIRSTLDVLNTQLCEPEIDGGFHQLKCLKGNCQDCGMKKLADHFQNCDLNMEAEAIWQKWETVEGRKVLSTKKGTIYDVTQELYIEMRTFPLHYFRAQWQAKEFSFVKKHPPRDSCISVMDFAENYRCIYQDEAQSAHWSYAQATIHPIVNYYSCHDCAKVVTDVIAFITPDLKHDTAAVARFMSDNIEILSSKGYTFDRFIQWTDGCGAQYKNKIAFKDLSELKSVKVERNFFGSRHGKNACDGESAVIKSAATRSVKSRQAVIQSAQHLFAFCKTYLRKNDYRDGVCCHYRRDFVLVQTIVREEGPNLYPVKGTRSLHSIKANGSHNLLIRSLSCFCHGCENGEDCYNTAYVESWNKVKLRSKSKDMVHCEQNQHENPESESETETSDVQGINGDTSLNITSLVDISLTQSEIQVLESMLELHSPKVTTLPTMEQNESEVPVLESAPQSPIVTLPTVSVSDERTEVSSDGSQINQRNLFMEFLV